MKTIRHGHLGARGTGLRQHANQEEGEDEASAGTTGWDGRASHRDRIGKTDANSNAFDAT